MLIQILYFHFAISGRKCLDYTRAVLAYANWRYMPEDSIVILNPALNEDETVMYFASNLRSKKGLDIVENMPEQFRAKWESLSDQRKGELLEEAKFYKLNTANEIAYFWQTRDLRETKQVVERLDTDSARMWNTEANLKEQNDYIGSVMGQVKRRMGGF